MKTELTVLVKGISQKYTRDTEGHRHVDITIKAEVKEGIKDVAELSNLINKPVHLDFEELQPGLVDTE